MLHAEEGVVVYRGTRTEDAKPVLIKCLGPAPRPREFRRLRNEYELGAHLTSERALRPIGLESYLGMPALILEDLGGEPLARIIGAPMEVGHFLRLATQLAGALAEIHRAQVIHKCIRPASVMLVDGGDVRLTDFGIASRVPREPAPFQNTGVVEGSLPYMSPEQTGRMNRAVDYRTDLYSLGVTLYELLTGRHPFEANDPLEWVHCHIARTPRPPSTVTRGVPEALSRIVLKLLAKLAEERYQTAAGLAHDLARCLTDWEKQGAISPFRLGERDVSDRFQVPDKLYGRERETAVLAAAFDRLVATGTPELMLVSGHPGIGKSALVHELHRSISRECGVFISGKFDQFKRNVPYATIIEALRGLVLELLGERDHEFAAWRRRISEALGINGQLIVDVIPPLELVIGKQPAVAELPLAEAQNRFSLVFHRFLSVFAREEHPLVLFLDDLQWADPASLRLLQHLLTNPETRSLFVIGAFRDTEVDPFHPLRSTLAALGASGLRIEEIALGPLSEDDLAAIISDTVHAGVGEAEPLAALVHERTSGNPFFAVQLLAALHQEELVRFDREAGRWRWDVDEIRARGFTADVLELMVTKLRRLPPRAQASLEIAACVGSRADDLILSAIETRPAEEIGQDLFEAVREGLLIRRADHYQFLHDRVQEAAYSLIPEAERAAAHLRIGRLLVAHLSPAEREAHVFDVVSQLDRGAALVTSQDERDVIGRLDFLAGTKARASVAYAAARTYFARAAALLPAGAWAARYEEAFRVHLALAECEYLTGNFAEADELFKELLERAGSRGRAQDQARVYALRMRLYQVAGHYDDAVAVALEALRLFDVTFPEPGEALKAATDAELRHIEALLEGRRIADLLDAPAATDPDARAIISLLVEAEPCVYIGRPALFPLLALKAVASSLRHGNTPESCFAYSVYGLMLVSILDDIPSGFEFSEMSLRLNERLGDARLRGTLLHLHGDHVNFWRRPFATGFPILERAFTACLEVGDLVYAGFLAFETVWQVLERGAPLDEVVEVSRRFLAFAQKSGNQAVYQTIRLEQQFVACLKGATVGATSFDAPRGCAAEAFDEESCLAEIERAAFGCGVVFFAIMKQIACFLDGRIADSLTFAAEAKRTLGAAMAMPIEATHHFFHALALAAHHADAPPEARADVEVTLEALLAKLTTWAEHSPENYRCRRALVAAEVAAVKGQDLEAMRLYERAIRAAADDGFVYVEAIGAELAARFHAKRRLARAAAAFSSDARSAYVRWGADGCVKRLESGGLGPGLPAQGPAWTSATGDGLRATLGADELALRGAALRDAPWRSPTAARVTPSATFSASATELDLISVVKASQTISGDLALGKLVETLMRVVLEQGGAQRGCLLLFRDGQLTIQADAAVGAAGFGVELLSAEPVSSRRLPDTIVNYVWRTQARLIVDHAASSTFARDEYVARQQPLSILCLPIVRQAKGIGLVYLENDAIAGAFTPERLAVLELLAAQAAISIENALLLTAEQTAKVEAQRAERRAAFLGDVGELLTESLDAEHVLTRLAQLCVGTLADWCIIDLLERDGVHRVASVHADPAKAATAAELRRRYPPTWDSPQPSAIAMRTGKPILLDVGQVPIREHSFDAEHARLVRAMGTRSTVAVPLVARGQAFGALTLGSATRVYEKVDVDLFQEIGRRASIAVDNARLYAASQEAVRAREEFLSIASHELRTPMTSLMLSLDELTRRAAGSPAPERRLVDLAERQAHRMNRLIDELLSVTRIVAGRLELCLEPTELGGVVRDVALRFEAEAATAGCQLEVFTPTSADGGVVGAWDRSRLEQVISNLIANAIKFSGGQRITVSISRCDDGTARVQVRDRGIGIAPDRQPTIFDRFARAVSAQHYGGLGLGLYICREIVEAHGGSIRVESTIGQGSTFTVDLPTATRQTELTVTPSPLTSQDTPPPTSPPTSSDASADVSGPGDGI